MSKIQTLRTRLEVGYEAIETARQKGTDVRAWENLWISLLREYERECSVSN